MPVKPSVLYVAPYRDGTGWGHAAIDYIRALDLAGVDVACRPVKLNRVQAEVHPRVLELERNNFRRTSEPSGEAREGPNERPKRAREDHRYDAVIQHVLPHMMDYNVDCGKNVGLYFSETSNFRRAAWAARINCMDEAWVPCHQGVQASEDSGVTVPTRVVPIPCDFSRYTRAYNPLPQVKAAQSFVFYWIGEFNRRKNLKALITAFHTEFDVNEPVSLLLKVTPQGDDEHSAWDVRKAVVDYCTGIKQGLKIYDRVDQYKEEIVLSGRFPEEDVMRLHASCDCGVFPSYGEAWCMPAFDSMALGKTPIVTEWGGFERYMTPWCGWTVPCRLEPVYGTHMDTFPDLHTGREEWASIDVVALQHAMRQAYECPEMRREKAEAGLERAHEFRYEAIGPRMREAICG